MTWGKPRKLGKWNLLLPLLALCWASSAQAAGFDCARAGTAVEKMICADAELSKLDDEMAAAYKTALQNEKRATSIRQKQEQWLKKRNICHDADCVKRAYAAGLRGLAKNSAQTEYPAQKKIGSNFSGQWHIELCDKNINEECGGFTLYLIQTGEKICGDHFFATPGGGRLNEGSPCSIIGSVTENNVANIIITSGRNGAVYRARVIKDGDTLNWKIIEEIKPGSEGESALVLDYGNLQRERVDKDEYRFQHASSTCKKLIN